MNKSYYTAYLPTSRSGLISTRAKATSSTDTASQQRLEDLDRRLDKNKKTLSQVDEVCVSNLDKCKRYFSIARNYQAF